MGRGFHSHGGISIAGWFIVKTPNLKWMMTGGRPMTSYDLGHLYFMAAYGFFMLVLSPSPPTSPSGTLT